MENIEKTHVTCEKNHKGRERGERLLVHLERRGGEWM